MPPPVLSASKVATAELPSITELVIANVPSLFTPPPRQNTPVPPVTVLLEIRQLRAVAVPVLLNPPPYLAPAPPITEFSRTMQLLIVSELTLLMPPPLSVAELPWITQSRSANVASL